MGTFRILSVIIVGFLLVNQYSCKSDDPIDCVPVTEEAIPYEMELPRGFPPMSIPVDNPLTVQGVNLGRHLFYDNRLSGDNTQSCATCHLAENSFSDPNRFSEGITGALGDRNAMAIINLGYAYSLFWDGRSSTLEEQALEPVTNPIEMNATWPEVLIKLNEDDYYKEQFKIAFGVDVIDSTDVAKAIAQFERTMLSGESKFDKFLRKEVPFTESELRGRDIFDTERGDCFHCHGTRLLTGFQDQNNGVQQVMEDLGVGGVNGDPNDIGKFKPPSLRNIELTGPYMHDGRFETLEEVIEFYNSGVNQSSPNVSPLMLKPNRINGSLNFTQQEKDDLLAYLLTFTDLEFTTNPDFLEP
ncbi:MAG: cytochrome-c peroxidase [Salibacteraceae bacterium]